MAPETPVSLPGSTVYIFDCALHGPEITKFCDRALQRKYRHCWSKHIRTDTPVPFGDGELNRLLDTIGAPMHGRSIPRPTDSGGQR